WSATLLGLLTLAIVYLLPAKINRLLPSPLLALTVGTLVLYFAGGGRITEIEEAGQTIYLMGGARVLGDIPTAIPTPMLPMIEWSLLVDMIKSALMLATLGTIDSLLTSLVADNITRTQHDSNRELVGQGIGNMVSGLFGGLPGAGATMRTVVNVRVGGQTPISGALHALVLLFIVLGAGSVVQYIPHAVLAGILLKVGTDIIDWDYLRRLKHAPHAGIAIMATVFFVTVFIDLITAVAVGMIMASLVFVERMSNLQIESITTITDPQAESPLTEEEKRILGDAHGRILLYHMRGPMSFGAAKGMVRRLSNFDQYGVLVLDLSDVPLIDDSATRALGDMIGDAQRAEREVFLISSHKRVNERLERQGIYQMLPAAHVFPRRLDALRAASAVISPNSADAASPG
ncbi:MAG: SulP family inorganic anion transporter, partial [Gammaproteobacteria bacterium]|nr:SulP family inorganic anion transporter [Gammaproteobacteria bacterium]